MMSWPGDYWWNRAKDWWKLALKFTLLNVIFFFFFFFFFSLSQFALLCFTLTNRDMLVFKPCENFLLLLPTKFFTTTAYSKPHHHHHDVKQLHFPSLKAHFKSILSSSSPAAAPSEGEEEEEEDEEDEEDSSSSLTTTTTTTTTVDFLMESGGLSYEQAIQVIQEKPTLLKNGGRKPRLVIAYFESIGFSKTHISKITSKKPKVLASDVEKTLKPKIQMFLDFGFSKSDIAELMSSEPTLLHTGLKTQIKPALDLIKSFLIKTDDDEDLLIKIIKRNSHLLLGTSHFRKWIEPNIDVLRQHGVPDSKIVNLIVSQLSALTLTSERFKIIVEKIVSLGFKPETRKFSTAVAAMSSMKKATWDSKIDLLKGLGWSQVQILDAFISNPGLLRLSGEKMKEGIEFFKESLNWDASVLSQNPVLLNYSLKRRVIPRYAVLKCLMSKEIKQERSFIHMLMLNEAQFLSKHVFKYQEQLPYLYEVYKKECMLGGCEKDNGDIDMTV